VLDAKVNGIYVHGKDGVVAVPTVSMSGAAATLACATSGAAIKYTLDGSNPKNSATAATYSAAVTLAAGQTIRFYASKAGLVNSCIVEKTYIA